MIRFTDRFEFFRKRRRPYKAMTSQWAVVHVFDQFGRATCGATIWAPNEQGWREAHALADRLNSESTETIFNKIRKQQSEGVT